MSASCARPKRSKTVLLLASRTAGLFGACTSAAEKHATASACMGGMHGRGGCTLLVGEHLQAKWQAKWHGDEASQMHACLCGHLPSSAPRLQQSRPRCLRSDALVLIILCAPLWPVGRQA